MIIQAKASKRPNLTVNFSQGGKVASFKDSPGKAGSWGHSCISAGRYGVEVPLVLLCAGLRALKKDVSNNKKSVEVADLKTWKVNALRGVWAYSLDRKTKNKC